MSDEIIIDVFEEEHGWSYKVGNIYQPYHPSKEGFVPMTQNEAELLAQEIKLRLM